MDFSAKNLLLLGSVCFIASICNAQLLEGIYCGRDNCYDVLNITREATQSEVKKSYRRLAKTTHPDLFRGEQQKYEAEQRFKAIGEYFTIFDDVDKNTIDLLPFSFDMLAKKKSDNLDFQNKLMGRIFRIILIF